ncbi:MAG: hypothetical protein MZV70_47040 [Desulfobacterales bacterium]|nr:hypothetical protein [Desulfobacterales bacterium]
MHVDSLRGHVSRRLSHRLTVQDSQGRWGQGAEITAIDLIGYPDGTYTWATSSRKIRLHNADSSSVTVEALADPSDHLDAETITVTRTAPGCPPIEKTVSVTVARVTFSASRNQMYGYDNFNTPNNPVDDHVCVKCADYTFVKVDIEGGAIGTDFAFACDSGDVVPDMTCGVRLLRPARERKPQHLQDGHDPSRPMHLPGSHTSFASLAIHVYREKEVRVVVAKIKDGRYAGTNVHYPALNASTHTQTVNAKLKEAVVRFDITNFDAANGVTNIAYDLDGDGALSYDINASGALNCRP